MPPRALHVVRHAKAENRRGFTGEDRYRPLTADGGRQAAAIAERLAKASPAVGLVLSSPATRCIETVEPLAASIGLEVEADDRLFEGGDPLEVLAFLLEAGDEYGAVAACTHGDVAYGLLEALAEAGAELDGPIAAPKASTWELTVAGARVVKATLVPPPAAAG